MSLRLMFTVCAVLLAASCDDLTSNLEPDPALMPRDSVVRLVAATDSVPADGLSRVLLTARIAEAAGPTSITFFTTAGVFAESGTNTVVALAQVDPEDRRSRLASVALRAPVAAASAIVRATVGLYYDSTTVVFTP